MFLFLVGFSGLLLVRDVEMEGSDVVFDTSGCSLVTVISSFCGNEDMVAVSWYQLTMFDCSREGAHCRSFNDECNLSFCGILTFKRIRSHEA